MGQYTVVLLRPDYLCCDVQYGQDIYVAQVSAPSVEDACMVAQNEVYEADRRDHLGPDAPDDYALCVAFLGFHSPKLFGWQI